MIHTDKLNLNILALWLKTGSSGITLNIKSIEEKSGLTHSDGDG